MTPGLAWLGQSRHADDDVDDDESSHSLKYKRGLNQTNDDGHQIRLDGFFPYYSIIYDQSNSMTE